MKATFNAVLMTKCFYRLRFPVLSYSRMRVRYLSAVNDKKHMTTDQVECGNLITSRDRRESTFFHSVLEENPKCSGTILKRTYFSDLLAKIPDTHLRLNADVLQLDAESVLPYLATLTRKLISKTLDCSSPELTQFASYLRKNIKNLRKDDIPKMLSLIYLWPVENKLERGNMSQIIFALDNACKIYAMNTKDVSIEELLLWIEPWHWLGLCTHSEFVEMSTAKLFWCAERTEHVVQLVFYMGELRILPRDYDRDGVEKKICRYLRHFSHNEVGILAAGFYKSSTKLTNYLLYKHFVKRVVHGADKFHNISLNAVLKVLRVVPNAFNKEKDIISIHNALLPLAPSMEALCLIQAAMLGTPQELVPQDFMIRALKILCQHVKQLREKDLQRIMYVCAIAMREDDVLEFVHHAVEEIYIRKWPDMQNSYIDFKSFAIHKPAISFIESVLFVHILGYRSRELISSAIGIEIRIPGTKSVAAYYLDVIVDFLFPDYIGPRLDELDRRKYHEVMFPGAKVSRPTTHWFSYEWRETTSEMLRLLYLDVCDACGGRSYVSLLPVLPLYEHKDYVVCTDKDGKFVPVPPEFGREPPWSAKLPVNKKDITFCVLMLLRDRSGKGMPDYTLFQKLRETLLRSMGYRVAVVRYKVFENIPQEEKLAYIRETIKLAN